ncbi:SMI1/KNR4 family protein [Alkalihalobacterium chitinilyticum]|uniref:SMI1/KNR4 family protein n=1 Tax=Alkalihalobacterium chitinilyticum TaxID=2980103 RepID=A0ABT5VCS9_9BACI|nr:SMI1/KNR4 family protein [Alkalihalobacterium chitinilyticum]MDE5413260.1 SMI1/KNR4 family protein [Alkalihalobacterium chitinilyticum]
MKNIWQKDNHFYTLEPLTPNLVTQAAERLKVKLPDSYIQLLNKQNGGHIKYTTYPANEPTIWGENHIQVEHLLGIGEKDSILDSHYLIQEWGLPKDIVILSGEGESWIAFDYRNTEENPPIIYIECESEENKVLKLANSFEEFLNGLSLYEDIHQELIDDTNEENQQSWSTEAIVKALSSNNNEEIVQAFNYLHALKKKQLIELKYLTIIENKIIELLGNSNEQIREIAALYAVHFNEKRLFSPDYIEQILKVLREDENLAVYVGMIL